MSVTIHSISPSDRPFQQPRLVALEQTASYPLGEDTFQLDHGTDYFAFFDRLGLVSYYVVLEGEQAIAVGAAVLRHISDGAGKKPHPTWYLCDLKVHPDYRRQHLSRRLFHHVFASHFAECDRGYAISMNPGNGSPNRVVQLLRFVCPVEFRCTATLEIYSLDAATMQHIEPLLKDHRGEISYLSLKGIKDLRLQSTGQMLPLLHVQFGDAAQHHVPHLSHVSPIPGYTHMFCAPHGDALAIALSQHSIVPQATASIVSHGMEGSDWRFILTSDI